MKIENGVLVSIDNSDIKDGVLKLPQTVKEIGCELPTHLFNVWASCTTYILMDCVSVRGLVPKPKILNIDCSINIPIH